MAVHDGRKPRDKLLQLRAEIGLVGEERPAAAPERDTETIRGLLQDTAGLLTRQAQA